MTWRSFKRWIIGGLSVLAVASFMVVNDAEAGGGRGAGGGRAISSDSSSGSGGSIRATPSRVLPLALGYALGQSGDGAGSGGNEGEERSHGASPREQGGSSAGWADDVTALSDEASTVAEIVLGGGMLAGMALVALLVASGGVGAGSVFAALLGISLMANVEPIAEMMVGSSAPSPVAEAEPLPEASPFDPPPAFEEPGSEEPSSGPQWTWLLLGVGVLGAAGLAVYGLRIRHPSLGITGAEWFEVEIGEQDRTGDWQWKATGRFESEGAAKRAAQGMAGNVFARVIAVGRNGWRKRVK